MDATQDSEGAADAVLPWQRDIHAVFGAADVRQVAFVPDAGLTGLIHLCADDAAIEATVLTTEEEGIGLLAGAWLGGQRGALLMQSSGVGNCINMLALTRTCRFPLLTLITMRGQWGEFNPWQLPMGQTTGAVLELAGVIVEAADNPDRVGETVAAAARMAFESQAAVAILLAQRLIGAKAFDN